MKFLRSVTILLLGSSVNAALQRGTQTVDEEELTDNLLRRRHLMMDKSHGHSGVGHSGGGHSGGGNTGGGNTGGDRTGGGNCNGVDTITYEGPTYYKTLSKCDIKEYNPCVPLAGQQLVKQGHEETTSSCQGDANGCPYGECCRVGHFGLKCDSEFGKRGANYFQPCICSDRTFDWPAWKAINVDKGTTPAPIPIPVTSAPVTPTDPPAPVAPVTSAPVTPSPTKSPVAPVTSSPVTLSPNPGALGCHGYHGYGLGLKPLDPAAVLMLPPPLQPGECYDSSHCLEMEGQCCTDSFCLCGHPDSSRSNCRD